MTAQADGSWTRVKACARDTCRVAVLRHHRNRSRTWCTSTCSQPGEGQGAADGSPSGKPPAIHQQHSTSQSKQRSSKEAGGVPIRLGFASRCWPWRPRQPDYATPDHAELDHLPGEHDLQRSRRPTETMTPVDS